MFDFLPLIVRDNLSKFDIDELFEIRIRANMPVTVNRLGEYIKLNNNQTDIILSKEDINNIVLKCTNYSIFTCEENIKKGFITTDDGIRIGIAGECVYDNNQLSTIKNIVSLNIRIPHSVVGCSKELIKFGIEDKNVMIISPPACGKTTILRDIIRYLSNTYHKNILVCDERNEINIQSENNCLGESVDVMTYSSKKFSVLIGVRTLKPDVIAMDELVNEDDVNSVNSAVYSGIKVICTVHGRDIDDVMNKPSISEFFEQKVFDRIFVLDGNSVGKLIKTYSDGQVVFDANA